MLFYMYISDVLISYCDHNALILIHRNAFSLMRLSRSVCLVAKRPFSSDLAGNMLVLFRISTR